METLFVLRNKFGSSRIVRNIYEYLDGRTYWLKQYRHVIRHGYTIIPGCEMSFRSQGILSAFLQSTPLHVKTWGNTYYHFKSMHRNVKGRLFVLLNNLEKMDIHYVTPLTMNNYNERGCYKFSSNTLYLNCIENGCLVKHDWSRKKVLRELMKI